MALPLPAPPPPDGDSSFGGDLPSLLLRVSVLSRCLVGITCLQGWFRLAARIVSELALYELKS